MKLCMLSDIPLKKLPVEKLGQNTSHITDISISMQAHMEQKPVKLIQRVKIDHSCLHGMLKLFFIVY